LFTVDAATDTGAGNGNSGDFRYCLGAANNGDTIQFSIGNGPQTITVLVAAFAVNKSVTIDATTQPGYAGTPLIELSGNNLVADGLDVTANNVVVKGLAIDRFTADGVKITGTQDAIQACFIGTDFAGTRAGIGNGTNGVEVSGANNTIGGVTANTGNLISGNTSNGVLITGSGATGNLMARNIVGADISGLNALANGGSGVSLVGANGNIIGTGLGTGGNEISGNSGTAGGVSLSQSSNNLIGGNLIGVAAGGVVRLANSGPGVRLTSGSSNNTIGGQGGRNIIAGNNGSGVVLTGTNITGNKIAANYIGLNINGGAISNGQNGVNLNGGPSGNTVGGTNAGDGNVISGNTSDGVLLSGAGTIQNVVAGDYIGTDPTGARPIPNGDPLNGIANGVKIDGASNNTIGALTTLTIISGNTWNGVYLTNASNNLIIGCYVGVGADGGFANGKADPIPNHGAGVMLWNSTLNTIGGLQTQARNVISGNVQGTQSGGDGVDFWHFSTKNIVEGNYIGTDAGGTQAVGNANDGVFAELGSDANTLGGTALAALNVISANGAWGVELDSNNNFMDWDYVGLDKAGNDPPGGALHNKSGMNGIHIDSNATGNTVGGNVKTQ
jgi:titin